MSDNFKYVGGRRFELSGSGCTISATSITVNDLTFSNSDGTSTNMAITDFGDIGFATLAPKTSKREFISFTGITQNGNSTATLTGVTRGLKPYSPYDSDTANFAYAHGGGTILVFSNSPGFYNELGGRDNDETITGQWTFSQIPETTGGDPVDDNDLVRRSWVLSNLPGGTVSMNRIVIAGNAGETVAAGNLLYLDVADGEWKKCDADTAATVENINLGIAQGAGTDGAAITSGVLIFGLDSNQSGLTNNTKYYASNTAGALSSSAGTKEVTIGISRSTTSIFFAPRFDQQITEDIQDALAGKSGTAPSNSNKFEDESDTSSTTSASKLVRAGSDGKVDTGFIKTNKKIFVSSTEVTFTNGNGGAGAGVEQTLFSTTVPGGVLSTNNAIRFKIFLRDIDMDQAAGAFVFKVKYGGTTQLTLTSGASTNDLTTLMAGGFLEGYIVADGATNVQKMSAFAQFFQNKGEGESEATVAVNKSFMSANAAGAIDSTSDQSLVITLTQTNDAGNDCVVEWCIVELIG